MADYQCNFCGLVNCTSQGECWNDPAARAWRANERPKAGFVIAREVRQLRERLAEAERELARYRED